jgi:ABC-type phosphate transport system substrate-binding protein
MSRPLARPRRRSRVAVASLVAGLTVLALAGCAQNSTKPVTDYKGEPKGVEAPASSAGGAPFSVWLKGGDQFTVTLYGSSTCPPVATRFKLTGHNKVELTVPKPGSKGKVCTMDYVPHTTVFATPNTIDRHSDVAVTGQGLTWTLRRMSSK